MPKITVEQPWVNQVISIEPQITQSKIESLEPVRGIVSEKIRMSSFYRRFERDFPVGTVFDVYNSDDTVRNMFYSKPLQLTTFTNEFGKKALRILQEADDSVGAYGEYFLNSLATMIFDTDEILYKEGGGQNRFI